MTVAAGGFGDDWRRLVWIEWLVVVGLPVLTHCLSDQALRVCLRFVRVLVVRVNREFFPPVGERFLAAAAPYKGPRYHSGRIDVPHRANTPPLPGVRCGHPALVAAA